jgi:site-specific DNA recombinase
MKRPPTTPPKSETKRCAIYTRKSTTAGLEQAFNTLDAQYESCVAYIQRQPGWSLAPARYDDGGFTGANIDRPAFQRLLADIEAGKVDIVVVYKVDRLSRSLLDFARVMERLNAAGASFVSVTQNFSTADAMGRLTLNMLMSFAEFEREMIGDRTRDKIAASRRKGKWTGGHVPFGYGLKDKLLIVDPLEARIVRTAFELLLQHRQMSLVARLLNEQGMLPRGARLPTGKKPLWTKEAISRVLRSPLYAGFITLGEERCPGEHPALVEATTFDEAQEILRGTKREVNRGSLNHDYLLRGLLRCGQCGSALTPGSTRRGDQLYRYYRCTARSNIGVKACHSSPLPAAAIEEYVVERIGQVATDPAFVENTRETLKRRLGKRDDLLGVVAETEWVTSALAEFTTVWDVLTVPNRGRLLRALIDRIAVDEASNRVEIHLIQFVHDTICQPEAA